VLNLLRVDLNCDMGESFGTYKIGADEELLEYVTSANIACGFHAGDPSTMRRTVHMAMARQVAVGAHPGYPDLLGFGRRSLDATPQEVYDMTVYQIGALAAFVKAEGGRLHHVKPHGALYNTAARHPKIAEAVVEAVYRVDPELILFGLSGSALIDAARRIGLRVANEVFADRTYQADGTLTPRSEAGALITDEEAAVEQVLSMVREGKVRTLQGVDVAIVADTVCIHGDGANAVAFAKRLRESLQRAGVVVTAL
jgi:5-oxoprolinase (ATP-hydrolysing) subunit A